MKIIKSNIYKEVEKIVGQPLYLVGGFVRDILRDKEPKDYDFCTPLVPDEIEKRIKASGKKAYLTGKRFGTLGVKIDGELVEITTFRFEKYERNNRKPEVIYAKDISEDLSRRDFTINAIAWREGRLIDPFCGQADIESGVIRAVGSPKTRFKEDPLRMLRAIRFATQFNFVFDLKTMDKITKMNHKILNISKERWMQELDKILLSYNVTYGLSLLQFSGLMKYIIPELTLQVNYEQNSPYHKYNLWNHTKRVVHICPLDINMRWAALLHDVAKPFTRENKPGRSTYIKHDLIGAEIVEKTARYLKWSNERKETVKKLIFEHMSINSELRKYDKSFYARGIDK